MSKQKNETSLLLQGENGVQVKLTAAHLEKWFARADASLQSPQDVITFLKSPAGEPVLAVMNRQLAEKVAMEEHEQQSALTQQQQEEERKLVSLLLGLMQQEETQERQIKGEAEQAVVKQLLAQEKTAIDKRLAAAAARPGSTIDDLINRIAAYDEEIKALSEGLERNLQEYHAVEIKIADIAQQIVGLKKCAKIGDGYIAKYSRTPKDGAEAATTATAADEERHAIIKVRDKTAVEINILHKSGELEKAAEKRNVNAGLDMLIDLLRTITASNRGEVNLYKQNGDRAIHYKDAAFVLDLDKQLVVRNGKYYVLDAHQKFDAMTIAQKEHAAREFKRLEPQLMAFNPKLRQSINDLNIDAARLEPLLESVRQQISSKVERLTTIEIARATTVSNLQKAQQNQNGDNAPRPSPDPRLHPNANIDPAHSTHVSRMFHEMMKPSPHIIHRLKEREANNNDPIMRAHLDELRPGQPMPKMFLPILLLLPDDGHFEKGQGRAPGGSVEQEISTSPKPG